jgi:hypothetical protein
LLVLYVGLIFGLSALGLWRSERSDRVAVGIISAVTVAADALFILGAGSKDLFRPIRRRRLVLPLLAASFMLAGLVGGLALALAELFYLHKSDDWGWAIWAIIAISWVFWGVLLYVYTRRLPRYRAIHRLATLLFSGSLAELLAAAPAHIIVSRRGGCFTGIYTAIGVLAGLYVMIWSFGPAIFLLFLQEAHRRQDRTPQTRQQEPRSPGRWQFQLRTLMLIMLATSVVCAMLKTFWLHWPAAAIAAVVLLVLAVAILAACRWLMIPVALGAMIGLAWVFHEDWEGLAILAVPMALLVTILGVLFLRRPPS